MKKFKNKKFSKILALFLSACLCSQTAERISINAAEQLAGSGKDQLSSVIFPKAADPAECQAQQEADAQYPSLKDLYREEFQIGVAAPQHVLDTEQYSTLVQQQFSSLTMENEMKPAYILDEAKSKSDLAQYKEGAALNFSTCRAGLEYAKSHSLNMRGHTLVWHSQTPEWFFYEGYDTSGQLAGRDLMLKRMEHYIRDVIAWTETNYPGIIYAWDVVNEAVEDYFGEGPAPMRQEGSLWYQTIGEDFVEKAFAYARKYTKLYAPEREISLIYNDYNTRFPSKRAGIIALLQPIQEAGNIDGIGLQSHIDTQCPLEGPIGYMPAVREFREKLGMEIQVTELDIGIAQEDTYESQGAYYQAFMEGLLKEKKDGAAITSVTVWGLSDGLSWRQGESALLFGEGLVRKPAFEGVVNAIGATASVIQQIRDIGTVEATDSCKEKIENARKAYESLTEAQKDLVSNYEVLTKAEETYRELSKRPPEMPPAAEKIPISDATVSAISSQSYTGKAHEPSVTLTYDGKTLTQGIDYTASYSDHKNIGMAKVKIVGIGDFTGSMTKTFSITVKKNAVYTVGDYQYRITNAKTDGKGTVAVIGVKNGSVKNKLGKIQVPSSVKIGGKGFQVTAVGNAAFQGCGMASGISIGKNVETIGSRAFQGCIRLTKVTIGGNLKSIGSSAFQSCVRLSKATIGDNVKTIGNSAFSGCAKLKSVTIGRNVKSIGQKAFYQCKKLQKITISSTVLKTVGKNALKGIHRKAAIKVPAKKLKAYQKLLRKKGQARTVKVVS